MCRLLCLVVFVLCVFMSGYALATDSCGAGYYINDAGECEICPGGYYCTGDGARKSCDGSEACYGLYGDNFDWLDVVGVANAGDCQIAINPGTVLACYDTYCSEIACTNSDMGAYYCPGVTAVKMSDLQCGNDRMYSLNGPRYACPHTPSYLSTYYASDVVDCIPCPEFEYEDSCDVSYGELGCDELRTMDDLLGVDSCKVTIVQRVFDIEKGRLLMVSGLDSDGRIEGVYVYGVCTDTGVVFETTTTSVVGALEYAYFGERCVVPDGTVCGDFYGDGQAQCMLCTDINPAFIHSDGARTQFTDCYGYIEPGYGFVMNNEDGTFSSQPCPSGDYCTGFVRITSELMTGETNMIGNTSCADVSAEHTLSDVGATGPEMCYTACDDGNKSYYPMFCDGGMADCLDGYLRFDNSCAAVCASGVSYVKTATGVSVPLFAESVTSPALNVMYNDTVCFAGMAEGVSIDAINIEYNDMVYHLIQ